MRASTETAATRPPATIASLLSLAAADYPDAPALRHKVGERWLDESYAELEVAVRELSLGLVDLGLEPGDRAAIVAETRPEWTHADLAILSAGLVSVSVYPTNSADECSYVLGHSEARVAFVEDDEQLAKVLAITEQLPPLEWIVVMAPSGPAAQALSIEDLRARGRGRDQAEWSARIAAVDPDDPCAFIYTSGTTGPPKGCVLTHRNLQAMTDMATEHGLIEEGEVVYLFLPLAHAFALIVQFLVLSLGGTIAYWERDRTKIVPNLAEVRPTTFPSVPRVFEKAHATVLARVRAEGGARERIFFWALGVGRRVSALEREGRRPGALLRARHALADHLALRKVRGVFGDRLRKCVSGAAPIPIEVLEFFHACGVKVLDMYGLTETAPGVAANQPHRFRFGSVGTPFPRMEVRFADDGELLVRGPNVFEGYYKDEQATRAALVDGWLHTGDLGSLDGEGFLHITGRKKDIIVTAGGKNVAPSKLESGLRESRWVSEALVVGDHRPYLVALVTLDAEQTPAFAEQHGLDVAELAASEPMRAEVQRAIDAVNAGVGRVEQIKRFLILPGDMTQEGGELTPTLKVRRGAVADKYMPELERLYDG
ncbi:MAG: long-chain fatty acid--CoA ligase [Thermoleophilaceae bacterium]|nr:long-chain fatty acid--CoA ligase [Thermoleophilaceae bacterium]